MKMITKLMLVTGVFTLVSVNQAFALDSGKLDKYGGIAAWSNGGSTNLLVYRWPIPKGYPFKQYMVAPNGYVAGAPTRVESGYTYSRKSRVKYGVTKNGKTVNRYTTWPKFLKGKNFRASATLLVKQWNTEAQKFDELMTQRRSLKSLAPGKTSRAAFSVVMPPCSQPLDINWVRGEYASVFEDNPNWNPGWQCNPPILTVTLVATVRKWGKVLKIKYKIDQYGIYIYPPPSP